MDDPRDRDRGSAADSGATREGTSHFVYVLRCGDDSLYTGYTTDVGRRLAEHRAGAGAKYTRGRGPLALVHVERFDTRSAAMAREHEIKRRSPAAKRALVADGDPTAVPGVTIDPATAAGQSDPERDAR